MLYTTRIFHNNEYFSGQFDEGTERLWGEEVKKEGCGGNTSGAHQDEIADIDIEYLVVVAQQPA